MPPALAICWRICERLELLASMLSFPEARLILAGAGGALRREGAAAGTAGEGFAVFARGVVRCVDRTAADWA